MLVGHTYKGHPYSGAHLRNGNSDIEESAVYWVGLSDLLLSIKIKKFLKNFFSNIIILF